MTVASPMVIRLTPPGRGAVATLLVEGPGATHAVQTHFRAGNERLLASVPGDRLVFGHFGPAPGEEVIVRRRTGQSVEVHCHGGDAAVARIERILVENGCRTVGWRDWIGTRREDPIATAARRALAAARTERTAAILLDQLDGSLRREIQAIQEDLENRDATSAGRRLKTLLAHAELGQHLTEPWQVVLSGQPNVGKSSLINALVGYGRAIVHHEPGTTRDVVSATTAVDGWPVEFSDTAGLHHCDHPIERAGVELARRKLAAADLVVLVFDASRRWSHTDQALADSWPAALLVHNKSDLAICPSRLYRLGATAGLSSSAGNTVGQANRGTRKFNLDRPLAPSSGPLRPSGFATSALTGQGVESLVEGIAGRLVPDPPEPRAAVAFTDTQIDGLQAAAEALRRGDPRSSVQTLAEI